MYSVENILAARIDEGDIRNMCIRRKIRKILTLWELFMRWISAR